MIAKLFWKLVPEYYDSSGSLNFSSSRREIAVWSVGSMSFIEISLAHWVSGRYGEGSGHEQVPASNSQRVGVRQS